MRRALPLLLPAVGALAAALPAPAAAACADADAPLSSLALGPARGAVLCAANDERGARGLPALTEQAALDRAAQGHGDSMVAQGYFDHVSPGGATLVDRARATGWLPATGSYAISEAIAWAGAPLDTAARVVAQWMGSPPHRAILLDSRSREAGIGVASGVPVGPAPGATVVLDAGVRAADAAALTRTSASKVRPWRSAKRCATAARRSRSALARCASISRRSKRWSRARHQSSTRSAIIWKAGPTTSRPTS